MLMEDALNLAFSWNDVDFSAELIRITRLAPMGSPKTKSRRRSVPLPEILVVYNFQIVTSERAVQFLQHGHRRAATSWLLIGPRELPS